MRLTGTGQLFVVTFSVTAVCVFLYFFTPFISLLGPSFKESELSNQLVDNHSDIHFRKNAVNEMGYFIKRVNQADYAHAQTDELSRNNGGLQFVQSVGGIVKGAVTKENPMGFTGSELVKGDPFDAAIKFGLGKDAVSEYNSNLTEYATKLKEAYKNKYPDASKSAANYSSTDNPFNQYDNLER